MKGTYWSSALFIFSAILCLFSFCQFASFFLFFFFFAFLQLNEADYDQEILDLILERGLTGRLAGTVLYAPLCERLLSSSQPTSRVEDRRRRPAAGRSESQIWGRTCVTIDERTTALPVEPVHVLVFLAQKIVSFLKNRISNPSLCVTNVYQSLVEFVLIISGSVFGGRGINTSYWWSFLRCIIPLTILPYLLISLDRESWGVGGVGDHRSRLVDCLGLCFRRRTYRSVLYVPVVPLSFSPRLLLLLLPCALVVYWFHTASLWWGASLVALAIFTLNEQTNPKLF